VGYVIGKYFEWWVKMQELTQVVTGVRRPLFLYFNFGDNLAVKNYNIRPSMVPLSRLFLAEESCERRGKVYRERY
jgi:hypothetical protein